MGRRSDHSREELREMALNSARELVESEGIQGLTTRAVARRMGYSVGTLYLIFANLDDLVYALNARTIEALREAIQAATRNRRTPRGRLMAIARAYLEFAQRHANLWRLAFEFQPGQPGPTPGFIQQQTEAVIQLGMQAFGEYLQTSNATRLRRVTAAFWSAIHGVCHLTLTDTLRIATQRSAARLLDDQVTTFLDGLESAR